MKETEKSTENKTKASQESESLNKTKVRNKIDLNNKTSKVAAIKCKRNRNRKANHRCKKTRRTFKFKNTVRIRRRRSNSCDQVILALSIAAGCLTLIFLVLLLASNSERTIYIQHEYVGEKYNGYHSSHHDTSAYSHSSSNTHSRLNQTTSDDTSQNKKVDGTDSNDTKTDEATSVDKKTDKKKTLGIYQIKADGNLQVEKKIEQKQKVVNVVKPDVDKVDVKVENKKPVKNQKIEQKVVNNNNQKERVNELKAKQKTNINIRIGDDHHGCGNCGKCGHCLNSIIRYRKFKYGHNAQCTCGKICMGGYSYNLGAPVVRVRD